MFAELLLARADALIVTFADGIWVGTTDRRQYQIAGDLKRICTKPIQPGSQKALTVVVSTSSSTGCAWGRLGRRVTGYDLALSNNVKEHC